MADDDKDELMEKTEDGEDVLWCVERIDADYITVYVNPDYQLGWANAERLAEALLHYAKEIRGS